jgi:cell division protein FtsL
MMKIFTFPVLVLFAGAVGAGTLLFWTSQNVQQKERQLAALKASTVKEEQSIRVLRTEWDYLNRPERLETLARQYLGMDREKTEQIISAPADLPSFVAPAVPKQKPPPPVKRDAAYHAPSKTPSSPAPGKTSPADSSHSFQMLLKSLDQGGKGNR